MSQGSFFKVSPDMISFPSLVTLAPAEFLYGESGCGVASRRRTSRLLWWGLGSGLVFDFCRSFPAPTRISAGKKKKNFSLVTPPGITVRNSLPALARSRIQLRPGEPGKPAPRAPRGQGGGVRREPLARGAPRAPHSRR